jgi:hypothetical protein
LKARKHFFKVFFTVRKVLTCGAATQRDETPLARFQRAPLPNGGAGRIPDVNETDFVDICKANEA